MSPEAPFAEPVAWSAAPLAEPAAWSAAPLAWPKMSGSWLRSGAAFWAYTQHSSSAVSLPGQVCRHSRCSAASRACSELCADQQVLRVTCSSSEPSLGLGTQEVHRLTADVRSPGSSSQQRCSQSSGETVAAVLPKRLHIAAT